MFILREVTKEYRTKKGKKVCAIDSLSLELPNKGMISIVGESGCGKTTLLNILGTLDKPTSGIVETEYQGEKVYLTDFTETQCEHYRNRDVGFIFQDYYLLKELSVYENVELPLRIQNAEFEKKKKVDEILEFVGLKEQKDRTVDELSGGQQQRVSIARAMVKNPRIILADEPTGNLDSNSAELIMRLLKKCAESCLVVLVTHDRRIAEKYSDRIIEIQGGRIIADRLISEGRTDLLSRRESAIKRSPVNFCLFLAGRMIKRRLLRGILLCIILSTVLTGIKIAGYYLWNDCGKAIDVCTKEYEIRFLQPFEVKEFVDSLGVEASFSSLNRSELKNILIQEFGVDSVAPAFEGVPVEYGGLRTEASIIFSSEDEIVLKKGRRPQTEDEIVINEELVEVLSLPENVLESSISVMGFPMKICGIVGNKHTTYKGRESVHGASNSAIVSDSFLERLMRLDYILIPESEISEMQTLSFNLFVKNKFISADNPKISLCCGRFPSSDSEVVVSRDYLVKNGLYFSGDISDLTLEEFHFPNIYATEQKTAFSGTLNVSEYLSDVKIVGVMDMDEPVIAVSGGVFQQLRRDYYDKYFPDSFWLIVNSKKSKAKAFSKLLTSGVRFFDNDIAIIYEEYERNNEFYTGTAKIVITCGGFLLILLCAFFYAVDIRENREKIGVFRALGMSNADVIRTFLIETICLCFATALLAMIESMIAIRLLNSRFQDYYFVEHNFWFFNSFWEVGCSALFWGLCIFMVWGSIWVISDKKPIDLIKNR